MFKLMIAVLMLLFAQPAMATYTVTFGTDGQYKLPSIGKGSVVTSVLFEDTGSAHFFHREYGLGINVSPWQESAQFYTVAYIKPAIGPYPLYTIGQFFASWLSNPTGAPGTYIDINYDLDLQSDVLFIGDPDGIADYPIFATGGIVDFYRDGMPWNDALLNVRTSATLIVHTATVPEPSTWLMAIGGFGLIGFETRRRRMAATRA
jgi:hypothetical protein